MRYFVKSFDGHTLNSTTLETTTPIGAPLGGGVDVNEVERAGMYPVMAAKRLSGRAMPLTIKMSNPASQVDDLLEWFEPSKENCALVVQDSDTGDTWTCQATVRSQLEWKWSVAHVTLWISEPIWLSPLRSTLWSVTSSPSTQVITVAGMIKPKPVLRITPNSSKNGGYAKRIFVPIYNPSNKGASAYAFDISRGLNTTNEVANSAKSNQVNLIGGISAATTTIPVDTPVGGGLTTGSGICYVDSEQIYYTSISGGNINVYNSGGVTGRGWGGTTAAAHADNVVIKQSNMLANGNDWRAVVDNSEVDRWIVMGSTGKMWTILRFSPGIKVTLGTAIAASGAISTITCQATAANKAAILKLKDKARKIILIGDEVFTFTNANENTYTITGVSRAAFTSSMAAHAVGDAVYWVEHEVWMLYNNPTVSAPEVDDTYMPMFSLTSSTNTSWVYTDFYDGENPRAAIMTPAMVASTSKLSDYYTDNHGADVFPATEMGMKLKNKKVGASWRSETGTVQWLWTHPFGATTITATGEKYRASTSWPSICGLQVFTAGKWADVWAEASPASAATWAALSSHSGVSLGGTRTQLRFIMSGTLDAKANNVTYMEFDAVTLALSSALVPQVITLAAQNNYYMDAAIENVTNGGALYLRMLCGVGDVIVVDCKKHILTVNGAEAESGAISGDWPELDKGSNTLRFTDAGTTSVSVTVEHYDRRYL